LTIHDTHPFPTPDDPVRRLRGRIGGTVSLWTAGGEDDRAGLTVSSFLVAPGEPARLIALIDPDSDLADALEGSGRCVVQLLSWPHRDLAEAFAGTVPAPGGPFRAAAFEETAWGPRLADTTTWAGIRVESARPLGWSLEVTGIVEELVVGEDDEPLFHRRGRYVR
jgi:flavin reductase (DIM6/NTAB) family NADH-FMN oxidoreductase RutF